MDQPLFETLGQWVERVELDAVPVTAREVAKRAILDFVGVAAAGVATPLGAILGEYAAEASGPCTLVARPGTADVQTAAFVNGAQGHALDFDDGAHILGGHPSAVVLPAALAVAQARGASGADLLTAYVVGFEVACKLGRAMNFTHYEKGWHPTATLGVFGAAAAAAKVMGLDASTTATALAISASTAAGIKANFGTSTKPLQVGRAAQNGVLACQLAAMGADANVAAFEHEQGFGALFNGRGNYDAARATDALENPWDLVDPGLTVKPYPCCGSTHSAVDAALRLRDQIRIPEAIKSIDVWLHPRRLQHTNRTVVTTGTEAKFSVQYVVALALHTGAIRLGDFSPDAFRDPAVSSLMTRVTARPLPEERWGSDHYAAEVAVSLADGRRVETRVERQRGNGPADALTDAELKVKFDDCCQYAGLRPQSRERAYELLLSLETVESLEDVAAVLRVASVAR